MTFLPIAERELRVAARRRGTFWTRLVAAMLAVFIAGGIMVLSQHGMGRAGPVPFGLILFQVLGWMCFVFALSAGVVLTSDCLSEERREGTLGLLFLTDLRGYDVVLGKLLATSMSAAYGLLAVFPVLASSFLLGGLTGGQFWRHVLAVANTLFFSLAVGLWVSAISRESQKAMSGVLLLCLLFAGGLPLIDWLVAGGGSGVFVPRFSLASPAWACIEAGSGGSIYWSSVGVVQVVSWGFLSWSCRQARRRLDETGTATSGVARPRVQRWRYGSPRWREAWRRRMLERNPIAWLTSRDQWLRRVAAWAAISGLALSVVASMALTGAVGSSGFSEWSTVLQITSGVLGLALTLWVVVQASRFLVEGVQTRALEQILVTPLSTDAILQGHWIGLRRAFLFPALVVLLMKGCAGAVQIYQLSLMRQGMQGGAGTMPFDFVTYQIATVGVGLVGYVTGLLALASFGMWMGLMSRRVTTAVIKTVVFVAVLPWLVLAFGQGLLMMTIVMAQGPSWLPAAVLGLVRVGLDLFFITLSRAQLRKRLREVVMQTGPGGQSVRPPTPQAGRGAGRDGSAGGAMPRPASASAAPVGDPVDASPAGGLPPGQVSSVSCISWFGPVVSLTCDRSADCRA